MPSETEARKDEPHLELALERLKRAGWDIRLHNPAQKSLPDVLSVRYPTIPEAFISFLLRVARCRNASQTVWFLCKEDFDGQDGAAFAWNEWELQSLQASKKSPLVSQQIHAFWNEHLPFVTSVKAGYAYLAIRTNPKSFGSVVAGYEPELEEPEVVSSSFEEWLMLLCQDVEKEPKERRFKHFS